MSTGVKFAVWRKEGRVYVVHPPGWPKNTELSFTEQEDMLEWAKGAGVMLKDGNRREGRAKTGTRHPGRDMAPV